MCLLGTFDVSVPLCFSSHVTHPNDEKIMRKIKDKRFLSPKTNKIMLRQMPPFSSEFKTLYRVRQNWFTVAIV